MTSLVLMGMRGVLDNSNPDFMLVHGDTATSTAAALAAFYNKIPVGHIEVGLRTYYIYNPWPEEINRQLTSRIATYHFAPTQLSKKFFLSEGVKLIIVTGNTVIDALYSVLESIRIKPELTKDIFKTYILQGLSERVYQFWINKERRLILITGHRRENFGEKFIHICEAIKALSEKHIDVDFVYPMHLNPNVRNAIRKVFGSIEGTHNMFFIEPLEYLLFIYLMSNSYLILTDSGEIQEEAPRFRKAGISYA